MSLLISYFPGVAAIGRPPTRPGLRVNRRRALLVVVLVNMDLSISVDI